MNVWFGRLVLIALAAGLLAIVFSMIPLGEQERAQPEAVVISPTAPTQDGQRHPPDGVD
ncbi:MAG: hypothetical protein ACK4QP_22165 [Pseudorhizobium sp.]